MKKTITLIKSTIRFFFFIIILAGASFGTKAQMPAAITIYPPDATAYDQLLLIFDPGLACFQNGSLTGLPSVAMHSGVKLITGEQWQYVVGFDGTGANGQVPHLTPTGDGRYSMSFNPSEFYGFPPGTVVTQICAVFNNGTNWNQDGRDFLPGNTGCTDFFIPLNYQLSNPGIHFNLNMNKQISEGNFHPLTDQLYIQMDKVGTMLLSDANVDGIYDALIDQGIEVDSTYSYKFRINSDQFENISRLITVLPTTINLDFWWNDDPLPAVTFVVDMNYQAQLGAFNPATDFVDIAGTMNNWAGSGPMDSIGPNRYSISLYMQPGVAEYKFRINGNWATSEFPAGGPNRMTWATTNPVTLNHYYNDYNPDTWPATFEVDMNAEIAAGRFNPSTDYLDIAGTMNGWGSHDVLFHREWTGNGVYTIRILIDKANPNPEFKFRINGDWFTSEFPMGGPNRSWTVQDTAGGQVNLFQCVYDITDAPYPPYILYMSITGYLLVGQEISGAYTYYDANGDPEGASLYQWYRSDDPFGGNVTTIDGASAINYTLTAADYGKYLIFQVTPVSATGDPSAGFPYFVASGMVGYTNIPEAGIKTLQVYPNPATEIINVDCPVEIEKVEIRNLLGELLYSEESVKSDKAVIPIAGLKTGTYFIKCIDRNGKYVVKKFTRI